MHSGACLIGAQEPGKRAFHETCRDMYAFVNSAARTGRKKVSERQMTPKERNLFDPAKEKEIKKNIVSDVLAKLEPHEKPPPERILRMRWVLEYPLDEKENKSPKARIVIWGYLDSEKRKPTSNFTHDEQKRQAGTFAIRSLDGLLCCKGDVSGAFLQGRRLQRDLCVLPVPELAAALNVAFGEVMKLNKAAHGLVDALVEWYISILTVLEEHVCHRLKSDPCCSIVIDPDLVRCQSGASGGWRLPAVSKRVC